MNKNQLSAIHSILFRAQEAIGECPVSFWELWNRVLDVNSTDDKDELQLLALQTPMAFTLSMGKDSIPAGKLYSSESESSKNN